MLCFEINHIKNFPELLYETIVGLINAVGTTARVLNLIPAPVTWLYQHLVVQKTHSYFPEIIRLHSFIEKDLNVQTIKHLAEVLKQ